MRIGGSFPFNAAGAFPIALSGGQYYYPPPGNYLITLGAQSCLQWWDPVQYSWRNLSGPGAETFQIDLDGYNHRVINLSGVVIGASITNAGSGGTNGIGPTTGTTVSFGAAPTNGVAAAGYAIIGGSLPALSIAQAGSQFRVPPLILIDPPPIGGIQATAVCTITTAGALNSVTLVNAGAGYLALPNVYVVPQFLDYPGALALPGVIPVAPTPVAPNFPPGLIVNLPPQTWMNALTPAFPTSTGALVGFGAATGPSGSGTLTGIVVTDYGYGYTSATIPTISFGGSAPVGGGVAATAIMSMSLTALTGAGGTGYTVGNPWESSEMQLVAIYNNNVLLARPARGRLTSTAGALVIEDAGFGFQVAPVAGNFGVALGGSIPTGTITFSAMTSGGVNDTSILQAFIPD